MVSDDEDTDTISEQLTDQFEEATVKEKTIIDEVFVSLTGWSLTTLMKK